MSSNGRGKACRISSKPIYRALGVENIRHRRPAGNSVIMRRLLSLDFVLEHPGLNWLPTEPEKVEFFKGMGIPSRLIPTADLLRSRGRSETLFCAQAPGGRRR